MEERAVFPNRVEVNVLGRFFAPRGESLARDANVYAVGLLRDQALEQVEIADGGGQK